MNKDQHKGSLQAAKAVQQADQVDVAHTPPRKLSKPPAFKQPYSKKAILKAFTVWALFSVGGWLAIPAEWLPLAAHCVGFGYYLLMIYGKARWLLPIVFGGIAFAGVAYLTIPSEMYIKASHTFMYSVMTIVLVITVVSVMIGARRAKKEYQEFVRDLLQRRHEGRLQSESRLSDSHYQSPELGPTQHPCDTQSIEPIELTPSILLEEELREAQEAQKNLESALLRALDDLKAEKDVRMNLEFSRHRLEEQLNREREGRKAGEVAYQKLEESHRLAQRQAEQDIKFEQKARGKAEKSLDACAKEFAAKEANFMRQEKTLQGKLADSQSDLESKNRQLEALQRELTLLKKRNEENSAFSAKIRYMSRQAIREYPKATEANSSSETRNIDTSKQNLESEVRAVVYELISEMQHDCFYCRKRFGAQAGYSGHWVCGLCETSWQKKIDAAQSVTDTYNQEMQKSVSLTNEVTLLQKQLQVEKSRAAALQNQLLENTVKISSLDESLNHQMRESLKLKGVADRMEKMYQQLCGNGLESVDETVLHQLEATHFEALKTTQKEILLRQMQAEQKTIQALEREKKELEEKQTCKICHERKTNTLLLPCRHQCLCDDCTRRVDLCPLCRTRITESIKIFIS